MTPERLIGESIDRLRFDYHAALTSAGGDEQIVTLYLPPEWSVLCARVFDLICSEVVRRSEASAAAPPVAQSCAVCGSRLFYIAYDPSTLLRSTTCARCGTASHV